MSKYKKGTRENVLLKYGSKCAYCGCKITLKGFHVDHIEPRRRGDINNPNVTNGKNNISNYNPSCQSCNLYKSTFSVDEFRKQILLRVDRLDRDSTAFRMLKRYGIIKAEIKPIVFYFETF